MNKIIIALLLIFNVLCLNLAKTITLTNNNFVSLIGPVSSSSIDDVIKSFSTKSINEYINDNKNINLYINSPGGSVFAGNHLVQYIKTLQSNNVTVNCVAQNFMSMAFIIMQSCNNRYVMFDSIGMQHQISFGMKGNIENFRSQFNLIERVNNILIDMEIKKIGITRDDYLSKIISDWWLYGEENVKSNVADELVTVRCTPSIINEKVKKSESFLGLEFETEQSKCPIISEIKIVQKNTSDPLIRDINTTKIYQLYDYENYIINAKTIIGYF